jgi:Family of unknown function (DUF5681)
MSTSGAKETANYDVGYRKPPKHGQFRPGQSGNRRGRPRGANNLPAALLKALNETVVVTENGERRKITKLEAAVKQIVNKAAGGEAPATKLLMQLLENNVDLARPSAAVQVIIEGADARL